jgi:hypothetical protein
MSRMGRLAEGSSLAANILFAGAHGSTESASPHAATPVREDGFPQATTVGDVNDGLTIYVRCGADSQKARNVRRSAKVLRRRRSPTSTRPTARASMPKRCSRAVAASCTRTGTPDSTASTSPTPQPATRGSSRSRAGHTAGGSCSTCTPPRVPRSSKRRSNGWAALFNGHAPEHRHTVRQEHSLPLLADLKNFRAAALASISRKASLAGAIRGHGRALSCLAWTPASTGR